MIVDLHEFDDGTFALVRHYKFGSVEITIEATSGSSAIANVDIENFRKAVNAIEGMDVSHE